MLYLRATLEHPGKPSDAANALRRFAAEILAHANRSHPELRQRLRALHINRRMYERRPFLVTIIAKG